VTPLDRWARVDLPKMSVDVADAILDRVLGSARLIVPGS
jgi:hypothetical protein